MRSLARSLVVGDDRVDDVVQDTWLAALERPPRRGGSPLSWLGAVVRNVARATRRREQRRATRERVAAKAEGLPSVREILEAEQMRRELVEAVTALPEHYRDVLLLRYFRGQPPRVIARDLDLPVETVKTRLRRGLGLLREQLDRRHSGDRSAWCLPMGVLALRDAGDATWITTLTSILGGSVMAIGMKGAAATAAAVAVVLFGLWAFDIEPAQPAEVDEAFGPTSSSLGELSSAPVLVPTSSASEPAETSEVEALAEARETADEVTYIVRGRLVGESGQPRTGVHIADQNHFLEPIQSLLGGQFEWRLPLSGPFSRQFQLTFRCRSERTELDTFRVRVSPEQLEYDVGDVVLNSATVMSGHVVDESGLPVAGARVRVASEQSNPTALGRWAGTRFPESLAPWMDLRETYLTAITDAAGAFRIAEVPTRLSMVELWAMTEDTFSAQTESIDVSVGQDVQDIEIRLERLQADSYNSGVVLDPEGQPVVETWVHVRADGAQIRPSLLTDEAGRFVDRMLEPQSVDYAVLQGPNTNSRLERITSGELLDVSPGSRDLVLQLRVPKLLRFEVTDGDGAPVEKYYVTGWTPGGDRHREFSNTHSRKTGGVFEMSMPSTPFSVRITSPGYRFVELDAIEPGDVTEDVKSFQIELEPASAFTGTVLDGSTPIAGAGVFLMEHHPEGVCFSVMGCPSHHRAVGDPVTSDPEGHFVLPVRQRNPFGRSPLSEAFSLYVRAEGLAPSVVGPLQYSESSPPPEVTIAMTVGGSLEGQVPLADGEDPAELRVLISRGDGFPVEVVPGADGHYRVEHLAAGDYQVELVEEPRQAWRTRGCYDFSGEHLLPSNVTIVEGGLTQFDPALAPEVLIEGRLLFGGEAPGGFSVKSWAGDPHRIGRVGTATLDVAGEFEVTSRAFGDIRLELEGRLRSGASCRVTSEVVPQAGTHVWELDLPAGVIEVRAGSEYAGQSIRCRWNIEGAEVTISNRIDATGTVQLTSVPCGQVEIRVGDWSTTAVVTEGEVTTVEVD